MNSAESSTAQRVEAAAQAIRERGGVTPRVALILGSGLGDLAADIQAPLTLPYAEIPGFPVATVAGHAGELVMGNLEGVPLVAMRGRVHFYEGYTLREVTFPVRVMRRLGADTLIVTNAAGGLNETFRTGDLMVLTDHLNIMGMTGQNPLFGPDDPELGARPKTPTEPELSMAAPLAPSQTEVRPTATHAQTGLSAELPGVRFLDMLSAYDASLRAGAIEVAAGLGFELRQGVYAMVSGPTYETMAEIRFLQRAGADAVGMSTIPEVIVARHEKMRVLGISAITDIAVGPGATDSISHADVLAAAEQIKPRFISLIKGTLKRM